MLFRETVAVYCENHVEHTGTPYGTRKYKKKREEEEEEEEEEKKKKKEGGGSERHYMWVRGKKI
jgi:hypothetical protein